MIKFYEDPIFQTGQIVNTPEEEKICKEIFAATGLDVQRVFTNVFLVEEKYGIDPPFTKEHFVISVELLVKDNFISKKYTDRINSGDLFFVIDNQNVLNCDSKNETVELSQKVFKIYQKHLLIKDLNKKKYTQDKYNITDKQYSINVISLFFYSERMMFNRSYPVVEKVIKKAAGEKSLISVGVTVKDDMLVTFIAYDSYVLFERDTNLQRREEYKRLAFTELKNYDFFDFISYDWYEIVYKMKYELTYSEKNFLWEKYI